MLIKIYILLCLVVDEEVTRGHSSSAISIISKNNVKSSNGAGFKLISMTIFVHTFPFLKRTTLVETLDFIVFIFNISLINAQVQIDDSYSMEDLVQMLAGQGVVISNITYE